LEGVDAEDDEANDVGDVEAGEKTRGLD